MTFNDNYCDDKDGLDEPETSACSMFHATHICPVSYKGTLQQIKTSRIQDGMLLETSSLSLESLILDVHRCMRLLRWI